ncbi:hypothetical protein [Emticicia agri]|uniref:Outer membrane protein beta-barrel domain-containing protein n=1 Tax=Emticicia agri TaxID=2492393 RepID=A0A4Q5LV80_9BACT|nr:hypothetical protein [Emticicia agri]RYU93407.1 hypothetical protein EWM59_22355 [Emticicia agri]
MEPIDKQTIEKLRAYETSYQEEAWEEFERFRKKKKKRPVIIFWRMAAGIAISLTLGWGIYTINQSDGEHMTVRARQQPHNKSKIEDSKTNKNTLTESITISQKPVNSQNQLTEKSDAVKNIEANSALNMGKKDENLSLNNLTEEKRFQPDLLQPHIFTGVLIRPKRPFMRPYTKQESEENTEKKANPLQLSIAIAGLANQAANIVTQQNFGLRGTTEIALSNKTELSTGIYIGRENLNLLNTTVPMSSPMGMPRLNQANYHWLNVEVPLNVRYRVWQKGSLAFSTQAGVSMMGAFNQTSQLFYENQRTVVLVSVSENGQVQEVKTTVIDKEVKNNSSNAQRISLGTALNFSLGIHYPLGKNQLSVEPFFKYPIGAFTAEKLHYSTIGVQLRWSLTIKEKK